MTIAASRRDHIIPLLAQGLPSPVRHFRFWHLADITSHSANVGSSA